MKMNLSPEKYFEIENDNGPHTFALLAAFIQAVDAI
jgi:hypothetical protein